MNGILKNERIAVPLEYFSNSWRSLEMPLFNCKIELKLKWTKYCVLTVAGDDNTDTNLNNVIFTIKDTKLFVPVVTLSANDNKKLSKPLSKEFKKPVCWNEYKAESENNKTINEYRYFVESNLLKSIDYLF